MLMSHAGTRLVTDLLSLFREKWYMTQAANSRCRADASQMTQRLALLKDISSALNKSNTLHWLCYGTLWGVLRGNSLLDYDIDGDLCVVNVSQNALARSKSTRMFCNLFQSSVGRCNSCSWLNMTVFSKGFSLRT